MASLSWPWEPLPEDEWSYYFDRANGYYAEEDEQPWERDFRERHEYEPEEKI